jgi:hypothetical protein
MSAFGKVALFVEFYMQTDHTSNKEVGAREVN